jgi:hypothetical protein
MSENLKSQMDRTIYSTNDVQAHTQWMKMKLVKLSEVKLKFQGVWGVLDLPNKSVM